MKKQYPIVSNNGTGQGHLSDVYDSRAQKIGRRCGSSGGDVDVPTSSAMHEIEMCNGRPTVTIHLLKHTFRISPRNWWNGNWIPRRGMQIIVQGPAVSPSLKTGKKTLYAVSGVGVIARVAAYLSKTPDVISAAWTQTQSFQQYLQQMEDDFSHMAFGTEESVLERMEKEYGYSSTGIGQTELSSHECVVVKCLLSWRNRISIQSGKPVTSILSNKVLLAIAKQCPTTIWTLLNIEGIRKPTLAEYGESLLNCLTSEACTVQTTPSTPTTPTTPSTPSTPDNRNEPVH